MSTLLIDNYDSYTYNVFHLLAAVSGEEPIVVRNDVVSWRALSRWDFDAIVLSPGPGRPERWHDFGVCSDILRFSEIPVLGVCLGHQGLGHLLDGSVRSAPVVMHGRLSAVEHDGEGLFAGIPQGFSVVRYHSLAVAGDLGPQGRVTAWTDEGVVMGIEHRSRPMWGVQFHPESIATEHGLRLFENFYELARDHRRSAPRVAGGRPFHVWRPRVPGSSSPARQTRTDGCSCARSRARCRASWRSSACSARRGTPFGSTAPTLPRRFRSARSSVRRQVPIAAFSNTTWGEKTVTSHDAEGTSTELGSIFNVLERELARSARSRPRRELHAGCSVASSATWATSARPTAARPIPTTPTCRTQC